MGWAIAATVVVTAVVLRVAYGLGYVNGVAHAMDTLTVTAEEHEAMVEAMAETEHHVVASSSNGNTTRTTQVRRTVDGTEY